MYASWSKQRDSTTRPNVGSNPTLLMGAWNPIRSIVSVWRYIHIPTYYHNKERTGWFKMDISIFLFPVLISNLSTGEYLSGWKGRAVNSLAMLTVVRIHSLPLSYLWHFVQFDFPPFSFENTSHNQTGTQVMGFLSSHISLNVSSCLTSDTIIFFITQTKKKNTTQRAPRRGSLL